ncbi:hypothetical protein G7Y89_g532 [Cudoniella acicularis]|uniref:DUF6603 domain-containing protein n=1 Tax=Cudoniella acicularis TaxID=354080 RepID=A0A8H4WAC0_9HELO|nr:hypothetical protein G7Y89_g532 [Cudoniella acicularis]
MQDSILSSPLRDNPDSDWHTPVRVATAAVLHALDPIYHVSNLRKDWDLRWNTGGGGHRTMWHTGRMVQDKSSTADGYKPSTDVNLDGLAISFTEPPIIVAGIFDYVGEMYYGGIGIEFAPYLFEAAGGYGPLVILEFAEISDIAGGFGYNSKLTLPTASQVPQFPFIGSNMSVKTGPTPMDTIKTLTDGMWINATNNSLWFGVGSRVTAFNILSFDAVIVLEFNPNLVLGIFADCNFAIPKGSPGIESVVKSVPVALWGPYIPKRDPTNPSFDPAELTNGSDSLTIDHQMDVRITVPSPTISDNIIPTFNTIAACAEIIDHLHDASPATVAASAEWNPIAPLSNSNDPSAQWSAVSGKWVNPTMGKAAAENFLAGFVKVIGWNTLAESTGFLRPEGDP